MQTPQTCIKTSLRCYIIGFYVLIKLANNIIGSTKYSNTKISFRRTQKWFPSLFKLEESLTTIFVHKEQNIFKTLSS